MKLKIVSTIMLVALVLSFGAWNATPAWADTSTITESFDSASGWMLLGNATLDTGWLRLTSIALNQVGTAFYNTAYPTAGHVFDIRFDYASYINANGAVWCDSEINEECHCGLRKEIFCSVLILLHPDRLAMTS